MKQPIGKLAAIGLAALGAAASVRAEISLTPAYTEPTLEITVADGETTLDDWLAANTKTLDGVQTLVKKGAGRLSSTSDISATFGGDIVIEAGVFSASRPGALGADTGAVYVLDGAQYCVDPADGYENATFILDGKPLIVAGTGPDNGGAIRHVAKYYVTRALGDIHLTDDALLVIAGKTGDIRQSKSISCNDKTLTVRSLSSPRLGFFGSSWVRGPGRFVPDCIVMLGGDGGFTNEVEVVVGRELQSWGWGSNGYSVDSTLRVPASGAKWKVAGGRGLSDTRFNRWNGPVQLDGHLALAKVDSDETDTSVVFAGPVHGVGSLVSGGDDSAGKKDAYAHLHLMNGANDFSGGVVKVGGSVNLYADGALPRDGGALVLSNSVVTLHGDGAWSLPEVHVVGTGLVSTATAVVPNVTEDPQNPTFTRGSIKSVVKEGAGDLVVNSAYATPLLDVREGTVSLVAGEANADGRAQLAVETLRGLPGAVVDANGVDQQVDELVGYPTVKNGGLRVANAYRLEGAMTPGCAKVDGTLTFADGCVFSVDDATALRSGARAAGLKFPCVIAEAEKIVGCPVAASAEWEVSVDAAGKQLLLNRGLGLMLLIR